MTVGAQFQILKQSLIDIYPLEEAIAIAALVLEHFATIDRNQVSQHKQEKLPDATAMQIQEATRKLMQHEPLQYILQKAWFYDLDFYVNKHVLIPRPETEELVQEALNWLKQSKKPAHYIYDILDIGTGSGCIPITLKIHHPTSSLSAIDASKQALDVAIKNATTHHAKINFIQSDFLDESTWKNYPEYDIIISNPPYIPEAEKELMEKNVLDWEPAMALFVPNDDALLFYRKIALFAKTHLKKEGRIFLECHYKLAEKALALMLSLGYTAYLKKDMHGNDRMIVAY